MCAVLRAKKKISVYISSTVRDLKRHRRAAADALTSIGYDVEAMEKYPAREDRPKAECEKDAAQCDIYVGIIGWRYGYMPKEGNPQHKSITQLEYEAAVKRSRLLFLSSQRRPKVSRPKSDLARIRAFRAIVKAEKWFSTFDSVADLTTKVMTSVVQLTSKKDAESIEGLNKVNEAAELGKSYLPNIQKQVSALADVDFVCIRLGPTPWWDTRLHLVSALASDFTNIRQFVLVDSQGNFVMMSSPMEIRRALAKAHPQFENVYSRARELARAGYGGELQGIGYTYPDAVSDVFPSDLYDPEREKKIKQVITPRSLCELGIKADGESMERLPEEKEPAFYSRVVQQGKPFVAVMQSGTLDGVVDRTDLAARMVGILQH
jgi:hypothetical protein